MIAIFAITIWVSTLAASVLYLRYAGLLVEYLKQRHPEILYNRAYLLVRGGGYRSPLLWAMLFQTQLFDEDASRLLVPARALAAASLLGIAASIIMIAALLPG